MKTLDPTEIKKRFEYADRMLLLVSRTFALNINRLAGDLRKSVLLAYLYLRIADTVEDDAHLPLDEKLRLLNLFAEIFQNGADIENSARAFVEALPESFKNSSDPNYDLCKHSAEIVPLLWTFEKSFTEPVCETVVEMCEGMASSLRSMEKSLAAGWFTLETMPDLLRYCYFVAGIVGKLLSKLFAVGNPLIAKERLAKMKTLDVSFGLALQLVNIIKDVGEDAARNVCFVPESICRACGFENSPAMFSPNANGRARAAVMRELVQEAWKHLEDAIEYTLLIPRRTPRIRLFCLWPLFMAAKNLALMGDCSGLFDASCKVKITRKDVKTIIRKTTLHFYSDSWIRKSFKTLRDGT